MVVREEAQGDKWWCYKNDTGERRRTYGCLKRERIVEKLEYLPESNLRQVLSFVEFLTWRATEQDEPLLSVAGVLSGEMLSAEEIEEELYGDRKEA
jgi:hypothetical protein